MSSPKTLLEMSGADLTPPALSSACLVLIDMQNEYLEGPLAVPNAVKAAEKARTILDKARMSGTDIIHIAHKGREGSLFDRDAERGQIMSAVAPEANEKIIEKGLPNAFAGTDLMPQIEATGKKNIILVGFMTHMCVSSTARAALDLGLRVSVDADACGTRDLPNGKGGIIEAQTIHDVALVELSDRFAVIARNHDWSS